MDLAIYCHNTMAILLQLQQQFLVILDFVCKLVHGSGNILPQYYGNIAAIAATVSCNTGFCLQISTWIWQYCSNSDNIAAVLAAHYLDGQYCSSEYTYEKNLSTTFVIIRQAS